MRYNEQGSVVHGMANELQTKFTADYDKLQEQLKIEGEERRKNGKACKFCGCEKLLFEPPVFFCNGMNCQSQRIRRNSHYYVGGNNQYYWCNQCYSDLDENANIEMADLTLRKSDLTKKKNDEVHEESGCFVIPVIVGFIKYVVSSIQDKIRIKQNIAVHLVCSRRKRKR